MPRIFCNLFAVDFLKTTFQILENFSLENLQKKTQKFTPVVSNRIVIVRSDRETNLEMSVGYGGEFSPERRADFCAGKFLFFRLHLSVAVWFHPPDSSTALWGFELTSTGVSGVPSDSTPQHFAELIQAELDELEDFAQSLGFTVKDEPFLFAGIMCPLPHYKEILRLMPALKGTD